jgi:hypothetical protein
MHLNFIPATTDVASIFVHFPPALTVAPFACGNAMIEAMRTIEVSAETLRKKIYLSVDSAQPLRRVDDQ